MKDIVVMLIISMFLVGMLVGIVTTRALDFDEPPIVRILAISLDEETVCHVLTVDGVPAEGGAILGCRMPR